MSTWKKVLTAADITDVGSGLVITDDERTKLNGIETSADVTDAANVAAAGAVMDTGNETIAGTKTFSSTIGGSIDGNAATVTNGVYTTSSVTVLADVSSVGSGAIITGTERTKLNGIEASADVTDAANVEAAGAVMDSEVNANIKTLVLPASTTISTFGASLVADTTNTAARSTLGLGSAATTDSTAYATSAQGTLASNALPLAGGTLTGALTLNGAPSSNLHAATKLYVDDAVGNATDNDVNTTNLLARLADLDNGATIVIGDAANTTVKIAGNLQVTGTTETINVTELKVDDLTIALASGSTTAASANNSGLEVDIDTDSAIDANPAILYQSSAASFSEFKMRKITHCKV